MTVRKSMKAFCRALYAAAAALAAMVPGFRQPQAPASGYEQFNGCAYMTDCELSAVEVLRKEMREIIKSIQSSFAELSLALRIEPEREIVLGNTCYVDERTKYSAPTEELTASCANSGSASSTSTNSFYEQTELNSCLA